MANDTITCQQERRKTGSVCTHTVGNSSSWIGVETHQFHRGVPVTISLPKDESPGPFCTIKLIIIPIRVKPRLPAPTVMSETTMMFARRGDCRTGEVDEPTNPGMNNTLIGI